MMTTDVTTGRIARLRRQGAYPVPRFVQWIDGKADFRIMDGAFRIQAVKSQLCWICGEKLGSNKTYVVGPMCAVNRVSAEPPSHRGCAEYAATHCPFMLDPTRTRREGRIPEAATSPGVMLERNPGVMLLWHSRKPPEPFSDGQGDWLLRLPDPVGVSWWTQGREATRAEVLWSIDSGLPTLQEMAESEGLSASRQLEIQHQLALKLVPA